MERSFSDFASLLAIPLLLVSLLFLADHLSDSKQDPKEPPLIQQPFPYFGHILGFFRHGTRYYYNANSRKPSKLFTLKLMGGKTYVVNSLEHVNIIQRNWTVLSLQPFAAQFLKRVGLLSPHAAEIIDKNMCEDEGDWGFSVDAHKAMRNALSPGPGLDTMVRSALQTTYRDIDGLSDDEEIDLCAWLRRTTILGSTNAVYGEGNPFRDPAIVQAYWFVKKGMPYLYTNILPNLIAPRAYQARAKIIAAFVKYFEEGSHEQGSLLVKSSYAACAKNDLAIHDIAKVEFSTLFGLLSNTAHCTFWMLHEIFSRPSLLQAIRAELSVAKEQVQTSSKTDNAPDLPSINSPNVFELRTQCPLLFSVFQETLRTRSTGASILEVRKDIWLDDDRYLLKKGSMVQMPFAAIHDDQDIWGTNAREFHPDRFVKQPRSENKPIHGKGGFRGFGGGTTLCPGRHFATMTITSVVALMVMRFDLEPMEVGGWSFLREGVNHGESSVPPPLKDIRVRVRRRKGEEWRFEL